MVAAYYCEAGLAIYHGDCRLVLPTLPAGSFDLMLTSPPYDNAREGAYQSISLDDLEALGLEAIRLLKPGGVAVWVIDGPVNDRARSTTPFEMVCRWSRLPGWRFLECLIYGRLGAPGAYTGRFRKDHEYMPVFVKDGAEHVCDKRALATRAVFGSKRGGLRTTSIRNRDGSLATKVPSGWAVENNMKMPGTVWEYGGVGAGNDPSTDTGHPAVFPEALARDVVTCFSRPGDHVLDPFSGSGTTARACKDLGRSCSAVEIESKWCDAAIRRLGQSVLDFDGVRS